MAPSRAHEILKITAKKILEDMGFIVKLEKLIECPSDIGPSDHPDRDRVHEYISAGKKSAYGIDVYGERDGEIIMYEVGYCHKIKLNWLRKHIGKTIHMPYLDQWCK